jgi:hypothetical protein
MAIVTTEITNLYDAMFNAAIVKYDRLWTDNKIDAETYAKLIAELSGSLLQMVPGIVQQQAQMEKDIEIKERQMVEAELTGIKQRTILDTEEQAKQYEVDNILPANLAVLQKQDDEIQTKIDLMTQQKLTEVEQTRGANATADKVEYEVSNLLPLQKADAEEVVKLRHTERVGKDKEVAALGLDNVVKQSEIARASGTFVYTPRYEGV